MGLLRKDDSTVTAAVITGEHRFDVPGFQAAFRSMADVDVYPQDLDNFVADLGGVRDAYDVLVFYNFHRPAPDERTTAALESLGETSQGIVVLHHALLAFPEWPRWSEICGIDDRTFGYHMNQQVPVQVADPEHPITAGLADWELPDETYTMSSAEEGSRILLTTDHALSMRTLAWTRRFGKSRVFCFQSGHDNDAFADAGFRTVLHRGIRWAAGAR